MDCMVSGRNKTAETFLFFSVVSLYAQLFLVLHPSEPNVKSSQSQCIFPNIFIQHFIDKIHYKLHILHAGIQVPIPRHDRYNIYSGVVTLTQP